MIVPQFNHQEAGPGYLATITSAAENDFILNEVLKDLDPPTIEDQFWLGGREVDTEWVWITDEPFITSIY